MSEAAAIAAGILDPVADSATVDLLRELLEAVEGDATNYRLEASERAKNALADAREFLDGETA